MDQSGVDSCSPTVMNTEDIIKEVKEASFITQPQENIVSGSISIQNEYGRSQDLTNLPTFISKRK